MGLVYLAYIKIPNHLHPSAGKYFQSRPSHWESVKKTGGWWCHSPSATRRPTNLQLFFWKISHRTGGCPGCSKMFGSRSVGRKGTPNRLAFFLHLPGLRETMIWLKGCWMFFRWIMDYSMFFFCAEGFLWLGMSGNSAWIASIHSKFLNTAYMTLLKFAKQNQTRSTTNNRINGENHKKALFQLNLWWAFLDLILSSTNVGGLSCPVLTGLRWFLPLLHPTPGAVKVARYERWFKKGSKRGPPPFHIYV